MARFTIEAIAELWVRGERLGENLDRDDAIESRVARAIHLAHATRAEGGEDFVRAEASACGQGHVRSRLT